MTTLTSRYRFSASHRLHTNLLTEDENRQTFGKCNNQYGHGHDYVLDVTIAGEPEPSTGLVVRPSALNDFVRLEVLAGLSHRNLNTDVPEFKDLVATTENLALVVAERLRTKWAEYFPQSPARLARIFIQETGRNSFEVLLPANLTESVFVNA